MALSLAEQSARLDLHEDAARLFDLSGDDDRLAAYLKSRIGNGHGNDATPAASEVEAAAGERLRALESAGEVAGESEVGKAAGRDTAACRDGPELFRRPSLLAGVSRFPQVGGTGAWLGGEDVTAPDLPLLPTSQ